MTTAPPLDRAVGALDVGSMGEGDRGISIRGTDGDGRLPGAIRELSLRSMTVSIAVRKPLGQRSRIRRRPR
jgi:hypothetical protein